MVCSPSLTHHSFSQQSYWVYAMCHEKKVNEDIGQPISSKEEKIYTELYIQCILYIYSIKAVQVKCYRNSEEWNVLSGWRHNDLIKKMFSELHISTGRDGRRQSRDHRMTWEKTQNRKSPGVWGEEFPQNGEETDGKGCRGGPWVPPKSPLFPMKPSSP